MPFNNNNLLLVVDFLFAASLAVVNCTNTGVVEESTEIIHTFTTICYFVVVDASTQSLSRIIMLLLFAKFALETDLSGDFTFLLLIIDFSIRRSRR